VLLPGNATSEVFSKALANLSRYRGGSFRAWVFEDYLERPTRTYRVGSRLSPLRDGE